MIELQQIPGWMIFVVSNLGWLYLVQRFLKSNAYITPIITVSLVTILVYMGGILDKLNLTTYSLIAIGCVGALIGGKALRKKRINLSCLSLNKCFFFMGSLVFLIFLLTVELEHYDNFSHWAIVIKDMVITEAIPTAESAAIDFKNYPLGASCFIYYVCKMIGYGEGCMLFAQGLLICSCLYAIFGIVSEKKRFLLYMVLGTGLSVLTLFNITIRVNTLLVDFILPVLTLAIIATGYQYRHDFKKSYRCVFPMLALLMIVKNTGVIFALFAMSYLAYEIMCQSKKMEKRWRVVVIEMLTMLSSSVTLLVWQVHISQHFDSVENKFEMDLGSLQEGLGQKTIEQLMAITYDFFETVLSMDFLSTVGIVGFTVLACIGTLLAKRYFHKKWYVRRISYVALIMVISYHMGILGMYLFSMPTYEALMLAGLERYASSCVVLYGGIIVMALTVDIENSFTYKIGNQVDYKSFESIETKRAYNYSVVVLGCVLFFLLSSEYNGLKYMHDHYIDSIPSRVKTLVGNRWEGPIDKRKYLIYASNKNNEVSTNYLEYVMRYYLYAEEVNVFYAIEAEETSYLFEQAGLSLEKDYLENMEKLIEYHDTLIIFDPLDVQTKTFLMERYDCTFKESMIYEIAELRKK